LTSRGRFHYGCEANRLKTGIRKKRGGVEEGDVRALTFGVKGGENRSMPPPPIVKVGMEATSGREREENVPGGKSEIVQRNGTLRSAKKDIPI